MRKINFFLNNIENFVYYPEIIKMKISYNLYFFNNLGQLITDTVIIPYIILHIDTLQAR